MYIYIAKRLFRTLFFKKSTFILKATCGSSVVTVCALTPSGGKLPDTSERRAGTQGCRPRGGDQPRAGRLPPVGSSSERRPSPAAPRTHEAPADEAPNCQSEAESGRTPRACTGASGLPGRGRVWLIWARTRASPPGCRAPMSSSRSTDTSSLSHCRTPAG